MLNKSSRREFLRKAAATTAGALILPQIVPASALGLNGKTPPSDRIVMAGIGIGSQGKSNMRNFLNKKEIQFVAVCDVDKNNNISAKGLVDKQYGNTDCRQYSDFREILEKEKLDAVCLALPDHWHAIISIDCANKKLDIYGEKPLARSIRESQAIVNAVKKNNIIWQTGSWQRSVENFRIGAELVMNGRIWYTSRNARSRWTRLGVLVRARTESSLQRCMPLELALDTGLFRWSANRLGRSPYRYCPLGTWFRPNWSCKRGRYRNLSERRYLRCGC
jgi:hypothetical protein